MRSVVSQRIVCRRHSVVVQAFDPNAAGVGAKVEKWTKTPFDLAVLGPRAALGALLSVPERLQTLQQDVQRVAEVLQDPRPLEDKQKEALSVVEETFVAFLEKSAPVETEILTSIKGVLPPELSTLISDIVPPNPVTAADVTSQPFDIAPAQTYSAEGAVTYAPMYAGVNSNEIAQAVIGVKNALEAIRLNTDYGRTVMLKASLAHARDGLGNTLARVTPEQVTSDPMLAATEREARILLEEVNGQFFSA